MSDIEVVQNADESGCLSIGKVDVPVQSRILSILSLDGSGSMREAAVGGVTKAQAVNDAVRGLYTRFKVSRKKQNHEFAVITYSDREELVQAPLPVDQLDDNGNFDPLNGQGGGTQVYLALQKAKQLGAEHLSKAEPGGVPHKVVIVVMSDGEDQQPAKALQLADEIKAQGMTICCALFSKVGQIDVDGAELLKKIASDPVSSFKMVYDAETLRGFWEASVSRAL